MSDLTENECPDGLHDLRREVRDHPTQPGKQQDALICNHCGKAVYDWKTMRGSRRSTR